MTLRTAAPRTASRPRTARRLPAIAVVVLASGLLVGCGPSSESDVCSDYDALTSALEKKDDEDVFDAIDDLAGTAGRFEDDADVQDEGEELDDIDDSDQTTVGEVYAATTAIGELCESGSG